MKLFLFILLAGCAVHCDVNNYYVIDVPPSTTDVRAGKQFKVYWNVPTMQCASKKIPFENLYEKYGIIQNDNDRFKGEKITILYDPGAFPALFKNESAGGKLRFRNGGVPQEGDLNKHLEEFKKELDKSIPDENFSGTAIIDFESWRPIFRQNFGSLQPYKDVSIEIEKKLHWWWQKKWLEAEAKRRFEEAARTFMEGTLNMAKKLRPNARWGFYGFPYCFNMASNNMVETCAKNVPQENDQISWLWSGSTALYPSVYSLSSLTTSQLVMLIRGRIREAARCANDNKKDILPYFWFRYRDAGFLSETDLSKALSTLYESRATGIIIWGSSNDVNTVDKCKKLLNYVENTFGPAIAKYSKTSLRDNEENETNNTLNNVENIVTENPLDHRHSTPKVEETADPEFHWSPPENYTQDLIKVVEEQIKRRFDQNETNNDKTETVLQNNNVLIDLILNAVLNDNNASLASTEAPKTKYDKKTELNLQASTTEINDKTSTGSSQITSNIVPKNNLFIDNETTPESQTVEIITHNASSEYITTERTLIQNEAIDNEDNNSQYETNITDTDYFVSETATTSKTTAESTTDADYDIYDNEEDNFFNIDTFISMIDSANTYGIEDTTDLTSSDVTKNEKKDQTSFFDSYFDETTTENILDTQTVSDTDLLKFVKTSSFKIFAESNESINESNSNLSTTTDSLIPKEINTNVTEIKTGETTTDTSENEIVFESSTHREESKSKINEYETTINPTTQNVFISSEYSEALTTERTETSKNTEFEAIEESSTAVASTEQVVV